MARLVHFLIVFTLALLFFGFVLLKLVFPSWVYDLPNNYKIRKTSNQNVVLGLEIDGDFETEKYGIGDYVGEFQYNERYVGVKALKVEEEMVQVLFYLVDTEKQMIRGPFFDEESYLAAMGVWEVPVLSEWITTTEVPSGARHQ